MAKIKELLAGREKLARYDELTEWKKLFTRPYDRKELALSCAMMRTNDPFNRHASKIYYDIPDNIKEIIITALEAEIKKLDEE